VRAKGQSARGIPWPTAPRPSQKKGGHSHNASGPPDEEEKEEEEEEEEVSQTDRSGQQLPPRPAGSIPAGRGGWED